MSKILTLKKQMIQVYGNLCWLGGFYDELLTAHHIIPIREKGKTTWENIALLNREQHDLFNIIENDEYKIAQELNGLFSELNRTYAPPNGDYYYEVSKLMNKPEIKRILKRR